jgi:cysteine desulfurase/selenocysteine lyase
MCGPSGVGILFGKMKYLEKMNPLKLGGGTVSSIDSDYCVNLAPIPERFEAGTPNTEGIIGSLAAIKFIKKIGIKNIEQHELELKRYFDKKIKSIPNIIYMNEKAHFPIIALNYTNINPQDLANYFGKNKIVVRGGMSCAKLSYKITDNNVGYVRISLYFYNDFSDIDRIISVLKKFKPKDIVKNII